MVEEDQVMVWVTLSVGAGLMSQYHSIGWGHPTSPYMSPTYVTPCPAFPPPALCPLLTPMGDSPLHTTTTRTKKWFIRTSKCHLTQVQSFEGVTWEGA